MRKIRKIQSRHHNSTNRDDSHSPATAAQVSELNQTELGQWFIKHTRFQELGPSPQQQGIAQPPLEILYDKDASVYELPQPDGVDNHIRKLTEQRRSIRKYSEKPITQLELSYLLWCTQGVKKIVGSEYTFRTVPSAGARHALETFVLVNRVEGLTPGIYHYLALEHKLQEYIIDDTIAMQLARACLGQKMLTTCAVAFIWVAAIKRMVWRYGQRGYRYIMLDAGHVCQNLYLAGEAIECGTCAIAAFDDDKVNSLLRLDGEEEFAVYIATLGKK